MPSIASSRYISPASSYHDAQPAVGKLRPWTRQKVEANARVKERAQVRRAQDAAKKDALIKVQEQPAAQRRAEPKFQKAERETSAQIGKVFAALAGGDERIAGDFCAKLPSLMKPGTDRKISREAYDRNLREILDHKVGKMTDAELQAVAKGVDGITHFRSDQADLHAVAQAVTAERMRRQPQQKAALEACKSLSKGDLSDALKGIQRARGDRENRMDWKSTMADMTPGELMTLLEQFTPTKNGGPSVATQTLSSMNFISKEGIGTEHPEIRQTGNDIAAIVTAAWDLLPEGDRQDIDLSDAVKQIRNASPVSDDAAVRDALRKGFGLEISNEKQMIFAGGRAGATVDANVRKDLASYNLNAGKKKDPRGAYQAASTRVRESINVTAATAKSPFIRPDGKPGSLDGRCTSTFQETKKDGQLFVKCVDSYDKPSFKLIAGAISEGWSPDKVTVTYTLQVGKNGDVTLAEPVSVDYSLDSAVRGQPAGSPRSFTYNQFKAEVVLNPSDNPIYEALKERARKELNEDNFVFLEQANKYLNGGMNDSEHVRFGEQMKKEFVKNMNLSDKVKNALDVSMNSSWEGFETALKDAVKAVQRDVMQNTFSAFLREDMDPSKSALKELGKAQRYLQEVAE